MQGLGEGLHGDCGHVTTGAGSGMGSPWRMWTCDTRCGDWQDVTLETVDIQPQLQGLGEVITLETVDM